MHFLTFRKDFPMMITENIVIASDIVWEDTEIMKVWTRYRAAKKKRKQTYRTASLLWRRTGSAALATILIYKAVTAFLFAPLLHGIWFLASFFSSSKFITTDRIGKLFLSPSWLAGMVLIALLTAFWNIYEFSILFHALQSGFRGEKCKIRTLLKDSLQDIRHVLHPRGWPLLLYAAVLLPFANFFLTSTCLKQLAIPEYIMEVIRDNPLYFCVYEVIFLAGVVLTIFLSLLLPGIILDHRGFLQAARESISYIRKRFFYYAWLFFCCSLRILFRVGMAVFPLFLLSGAAALAMGKDDEDLLLAIGTAEQAILFPVIFFVMEALGALAACAIVYVLYQESLTGELPVLEKRLDGHRYPTNGKLILLLVALITSVVTALAALGLWTIPQAEDMAEELNPFKKPSITCHRGYSAVAPENTLPAFQAAIDFGADCVELDVQMTKDGVIMISHDPSLKRCTGVDRRICDMTYEEVRALDAGSFFSSEFAGTKIPTLQEALDLCKGKIRLNIEIKDNEKTPELETETARLIRENDMVEEACVTALNYHSLEKIKAADSDIRTGYILAVGIGNYYDLPDADFFSVETTFISASMVSSIHLLGKTVSAWTVDRMDDVSTLRNKQVDDLITGDPKMVQETLESEDDYNQILLGLQKVYQILKEEM